MAIALLELPDDGVSLEFAPDDLPAVRARLIECFGPYEVEPWIDGSFISVNGERLIFTNDWDDPCLLATTPRGKEMLRVLAQPVAVAAA